MLLQNFPDRRPGQREVIERIAATEKRFVMLSAPTGAGKSVIAAAVAEATGRRTMFLTSTKALQAQYRADFPLAEVVGMGNYPCRLLKDQQMEWMRTCRRGPCHDGRRGMEKPAYRHAMVTTERADGTHQTTCIYKEAGCDYYDARRLAAQAPHVITNYAYWARAQHGTRGILGAFGLLVCDEAHELTDALIDLQTVEWSERSIRFLDDMGCDVRFLDCEGLSDAADGARAALEVLLKAPAMPAAPGLPLEDDEDQSYGAPTQAKMLRSQADRLRALVNADEGGDEAFVWDVNERKLVDTRLSAASAEKWWWKSTPRVLLMSATITHGAARSLGIRDEDLEVIEAEALIPAERRPIRVVDDAPYMNAKAFAKEHADRRFTQWIVLIDRILSAARRVKTIVHVSSYSQARLLAGYSDHADRIVTHGPKQAREGVRRYLAAAPGAVLVSPAVATGHDFPGDACRCQIIAKVPWQAKTPVARSLEEQHPGYSAGKAILKMVQQAGRSTRGPDDASVTFVVDGMVNAFDSEPEIAWWPGWFIDAMDYLPRREIDDILAFAVGNNA